MEYDDLMCVLHCSRKRSMENEVAFFVNRRKNDNVNINCIEHHESIVHLFSHKPIYIYFLCALCTTFVQEACMGMRQNLYLTLKTWWQEQWESRDRGKREDHFIIFTPRPLFSKGGRYWCYEYKANYLSR